MNIISTFFEQDFIVVTLFWIAMILCFIIQYMNYVREVADKGSRRYWNKIIGFFILEAFVIVTITPKLIHSGSRNNYVCYGILAIIIIETAMEWMTNKERKTIEQENELQPAGCKKAEEKSA